MPVHGSQRIFSRRNVDPAHAEPRTVSGACFDGAHSPWPRPFAPPTPQQIALPCSPASQLLGLVRLPTPVHHRLRLLAFPMRTAVRESELSTDGQTWEIPASDAILLCVMCSWTPAGRQCLA